MLNYKVIEIMCVLLREGPILNESASSSKEEESVSLTASHESMLLLLC